jgi:serine/threonine protein phosphatase 1
MRRYWQNETHNFVHVNVAPDVALEDQWEEWLRWQALTGEEVPHRSGKTVICGHTALANGLPAYADGFICIDTKAYAGSG